MWEHFAKSERAIWGSIRGSGKTPYIVQIDTNDLAYKCSCPSRQFPCKHSVALLLLYSHTASAFSLENEPEYVVEWLDKRQIRANKVEKEERDLIDAEKKKKAKGIEKRLESRKKFVDEGVKELTVWLKDQIRLGLLEIPIHPPSYFDKVAARMIDAKAPGLAGWVKAFNKLDFKGKTGWQDQLLEIVAQLNLLLKAYNNENDIDNKQFLSIKSLVGWTFNKKDIISESGALFVKDIWLVLGKTIEKLDELTVHRTWMHGIKSNRNAIVIDFQSKFSDVSVNSLIVGSIIEAQLAYYPGAIPHRAFVMKQKDFLPVLPSLPMFLEDWLEQHEKKMSLIKINPWINNQSYLLRSIKILGQGNSWILVDKEKRYKKISSSFSIEKILTCMLYSNNQFIDIAIVEMNDGIYPLGIFKEKKYISL